MLNLVCVNFTFMYSVCVKGKIIRALSITESQVIISYKLENYSNVVFPKVEIPLLFDLFNHQIDVNEALEVIEDRIGKLEEIYIYIPKIGRAYRANLHVSVLFKHLIR